MKINNQRPTKGGIEMRFRADNRIRYGQDHAQKRGIPSKVDFSVEPFGDSMFKLTAFGFGQLEPYHKESYGAGCLYVWGLTAQQQKRFEAAIANAQPQGE